MSFLRSFVRSFRVTTGVAVVLGLGCGLGVTAPSSTEGTADAVEQVEAAFFVEQSAVAEPKPTQQATTRSSRPRPSSHEEQVAQSTQVEPQVREAEPLAERKPVASRIARRLLEIKAAPEHAAALRGRIPMAATFEVFAFVQGPRCEGRGWADIGNGGYVCLEHTRPATADREPALLPNLRDRGLVPYHYAKVDKGTVARRWRSLRDLERGAPHLDELQVGHDYSFVSRRRRGGEIVLLDERGRVVLEREVRRHRPSTFSGRNLEADPIPADKTLAWTVSWPDNPVHAEPHPEAPVVASLDYHLEMLVDPATHNEHGAWISVGNGWLHAKHLRRFVPGTSLDDVLPDEVWVDVDLGEQTLAVMRGSTPIFATLISAGFKGPTPRGLFRIHLKQAIGEMSSSPGADKPYTVEAIPFIQYFVGNFALHTAYWHNRFGHPISHGCVNLSPADSKTVFAFTGPHLPGGWLHAYETEANPGTTVRVRRGAAPVQDKRGAVEPVFTLAP
jgi:hypothetical protein